MSKFPVADIPVPVQLRLLQLPICEWSSSIQIAGTSVIVASALVAQQDSLCLCSYKS